MSKSSDAYELASHLYDTFLGNNDALRPSELANNGVGITEAIDPAVAPRVEIQRRIDGRPVIQILSRGEQGDFRLSSTFTDRAGGHVEHDIPPEVETELLDMDPTRAVRQSLFMSELVRIALAR